MRPVSWGDIASYVRRERNRRRQDQSEFAREIGVGVRTVGNLEAGRPRRYDPIVVAAVESALDWHPGEFDAIASDGRAPRRRWEDPDLARLIDAWPRLPAHLRAHIADLAARMAGP